MMLKMIDDCVDVYDDVDVNWYMCTRWTMMEMKVINYYGDVVIEKYYCGHLDFDSGGVDDNLR